MKTLIILAVLAVLIALPIGYYGYLHTEYNTVLNQSENNYAKRQHKAAIKNIDDLRSKWWYKAIVTYPQADILEVHKHLDYQKGCIEASLGKLEDALILFNKCSEAKDTKLAGDCLYQQGNIALYRGNIKTAEKKWQEAQEKYPGGHDYYAQVNLELLKNQQKKAQAMAARAGSILSHRRDNGPYIPPGGNSTKDNTIKP